MKLNSVIFLIMASLTNGAYAAGNNLRSRQDLDRTTEHKEDAQAKDRLVVKGSVAREDMLLKEEKNNADGGDPRLLWEEGMPSSFDRTQKMEEDFDFRYYSEKANEKDNTPELLKLLREESNRNFPEERDDYAPPEDKRIGFLAEEEDRIRIIPAEVPETRSYAYMYNYFRRLTVGIQLRTGNRTCLQQATIDNKNPVVATATTVVKDSYP